MSKNIRPYNDKGEQHGYWEVYFAGDLRYKAFYQNDKLVGYEENYWYNAKLTRKRYYI